MGSLCLLVTSPRHSFTPRSVFSEFSGAGGPPHSPRSEAVPGAWEACTRGARPERAQERRPGPERLPGCVWGLPASGTPGVFRECETPSQETGCPWEMNAS